MKRIVQSLRFGASPSNNSVSQIAYALFRFYCGISIALGAGLSKVFHKINENGGENWDNLAFGIPDWFVKQVAEIGFSVISPGFWATLAVYGEFLGGLLIAVGLLTRLSALQMAFQFFVVSFLWYDEPMPFAMYYQQLIFWSFVLIAGMGPGRFSLDNWLKNKQLPVKSAKISISLLACICFATPGFGQSEVVRERISFTLSNPSLKSQQLEIRCFDYIQNKRIGYGCVVGPLHSRSDNKPVGTRIYAKRGGDWKLLYVLSGKEDGRKINLTQTYKISEEQRLQVSLDEEKERKEILESPAENPDLASVAQSLGLKMIAFKISGKSLWNKQVHVRTQLPFDPERSNNGFSQRISRFSTIHASYPVGTKIYLCDGPYWNKPVPETLLYTVDLETENELIRI